MVFILYGEGKNGKSVTMNVLAEVFGGYAKNIAAESLMVQRSDRARSDLARLKGARLCTASEPRDGASLDEPAIKQLTGGDPLTVRRIYESEFEFRPSCKIFLSTNHKPTIRGTDEGIWRRIWLIPFTFKIPEDRRVTDYDKKLIAEGPGILNWLLEGLARYRARGRLVQPGRVRDATMEYRMESDTIAAFLEEMCIIDPNKAGRDPSLQTPRADILNAYVNWCKNTGTESASSKKLADALKKQGVKNGPKINGIRNWAGIRFKMCDEE